MVVQIWSGKIWVKTKLWALVCIQERQTLPEPSHCWNEGSQLAQGEITKPPWNLRGLWPVRETESEGKCDTCGVSGPPLNADRPQSRRWMGSCDAGCPFYGKGACQGLQSAFLRWESAEGAAVKTHFVLNAWAPCSSFGDLCIACSLSTQPSSSMLGFRRKI